MFAVLKITHFDSAKNALENKYATPKAEGPISSDTEDTTYN
jgi:hypothetical protein